MSEEINLNQQNFQEVVSIKLKSAKDSSLPAKEMLMMHDDMTQLGRLYYRGGIKKDEYINLSQKITWAYEPGLARFATLPEFIEALKQLRVEKNEAEGILDHENDHALVAIKHGKKIAYCLHFGRNPNGTLMYLPFLEMSGKVDDFETYKEIQLATGDPSDLDIDAVDLTKI